MSKSGQLFFFAQVLVVEFQVGLVEDRVEVERDLLGLLGVGLLGGDFGLDFVGDFFELVGLEGEEEAGPDGGVVDFREYLGDLRRERG